MTRFDMSVRPSWRNGVRLAAAVAAKFAVSVVARRPLADVGAEALVRSPNMGRPSPPPAPGEIRVEAGPPAATLSLTLADAVEARATVFVLHGIRDSRESVEGWGRMLAATGCRAVLVDLRGHGRSTGDALTYGVQESLDLVQVLDALSERGLIVGGVGAFGNSYGAATAIQWAGRDPRVRAVVAVAPFASMRAVVSDYLPVRLPAALVREAIERAGTRAGFDPDSADTVEAIARTCAQVLLVHGRADKRVPPEHSERLHAAAADHSELVLVDGESHGGVAGAPATRLADRAARWFAAHLT
jgi:pimeloyl-ACP methyl ester carboxylesterase